MARFFSKERPPTLTMQLFNLKCRMPSGIGRVKGNTLTWQCWMQPTPLSRIYLVEVRYSPGGAPQVFIHEPDLVALAGGRSLPHVYSQKPTRLCLYLPLSGEWSRMKLLSETIIPWTALWLFFFEDWLLGEKWNGGGHSPIPPDKASIEEAA